MEESVEHSKVRSSVLCLDEEFLDHNVDKDEQIELHGLADGDITSQEKNKKKKKKHKGGLPSPRRILAFNTSELLKLDEDKAEEKNCAKNFSRSASFPTNAMPKEDAISLEEGSGDTEDSRDYATFSSPVEKISVLTRATSLPLKSALRGGYEELGIGPRPKLQVKWAPSVWEPPCSTISHTVNKSHSKDSKHGKKGKSSHDYSHRRQDKKKHHKSKGHSGTSARRHGVCYINGGKEATRPLLANISDSNASSGSATALPELKAKERDIGKLVAETGGDAPGLEPSLNLESSVIGGVHSCAGSLFEPERLACNFLCRQAM